jgi:hypothetical protein
MMLIINPGPTVNVIVVTINVIDVDHALQKSCQSSAEPVH